MREMDRFGWPTIYVILYVYLFVVAIDDTASERKINVNLNKQQTRIKCQVRIEYSLKW